MKRPGSGGAEGGGLLSGWSGSSNTSSSGPAVLKPLAPPPSYSPGQVQLLHFILQQFSLHAIQTMA